MPKAYLTTNNNNNNNNNNNTDNKTFDLSNSQLDL